MAYEVYAKDCINWWKAQDGKDCGKTNEYSAYMDSYNFYNTKKNGVANSCAIFYDTAIMKTMSPEANANAGRAILCQPNVDNCGAGCAQQVQYYKNAKRWYTKHSDAQSGDQIFFRRDSAVSKANPLGVYHTGAVVDWDKKGFYVEEGNTNGGKVAQKFYPYGDKRIAGFGRPKWTGWERPTEEKPKEDAKPTPAPVPDPKPTEKTISQLADEVIAGKYGNGAERKKALGDKYDKVQMCVNEKLGIGKVYYVCVNPNKVLNVRSCGSTSCQVVRTLKNNTEVLVYEESNGWGRIGKNEWCSMTYLCKVKY